jgi:hypothetical protein
MQRFKQSTINTQGVTQMIYIQLSNSVERDFTKQYGRKELRRLQAYMRKYGVTLELYESDHIMECFEIQYTAHSVDKYILLSVVDFCVVSFEQIDLPLPEDFNQ